MKKANKELLKSLGEKMKNHQPDSVFVIDCPEMPNTPEYNEFRQAIKALIPPGSVAVILDPTMEMYGQ